MQAFATEATEFGPLTDLLSVAGTLMAAAFALIRLVRGRANWEPAEEDVDSGYVRMSAVLTAVAVALMWWRYSDGSQSEELVSLTVGAVLALLVSFVAYSLLIGTKLVEQVYIDASGKQQSKKRIRGFRLTPHARRELAKDPSLTVKELFAGVQYEPEHVWTNLSRAFAKLSFALSAVLLTVSLSVALAGVSILLR